MTNISAGAAANREHAREPNGQFGNQHHSAPPAPPLADQAAQVGDTARRTAAHLREELQRQEQIASRAEASTMLAYLHADGIRPESVTFQDVTDRFDGTITRRVTVAEVAGADDDRDTVIEYATDADFVALDRFDNCEQVRYDFTEPDHIRVYGTHRGCDFFLDRWPVANPADGLDAQPARARRTGRPANWDDLGSSAKDQWDEHHQ